MTAAIPVNASTTSLAAKVIAELNLTSMVQTSAEVTRGEFAQLLLNVSSYKGNVSTATYVLFNDVPSDYQYSDAVYIAAKEGWMRSYLGGNFKPDQPITQREAAYAVIALLGYTNEDFTGDQEQGRLSLYYSKNLNEGINVTMDSSLSISECTYLLYNLLRTQTKQGSIYGALFDCTLDSDGEIDYLSLLSTHTNNIIGPIRVEDTISEELPFDEEKATYIFDGEAGGDEDDVSSGDIIFYSTKTKTVWVYQDNVATGTVTGIGYDLSGSLTPTALYVDSTEFLIQDDDMVREFSTSTKVKVGDEITVVYDTQSSQNGEDEETNILKGYLLED